MSKQEIFKYLFGIAQYSDDTGGVVCSCLVRNGEIIADGVSTDNGTHSEYNLLKKLDASGYNILYSDIVYTTVEPCGKRTPGGAGDIMGDCTTNLIKAGVKHIVYAAQDPDAAEDTRHKFKNAGCSLTQTIDKNIIKRAIKIFNSTASAGHQPLPE